MNDQLKNLLRDQSPETIEDMVLQHVRLERQYDENSDFLVYKIYDLSGNHIGDVRATSQDIARSSLKRELAKELLMKLICGQCGRKLLKEEDTLCSLCLATQTMDLVRIARELTRQAPRSL